VWTLAIGHDNSLSPRLARLGGGHSSGASATATPPSNHEWPIFLHWAASQAEHSICPWTMTMTTFFCVNQSESRIDISTMELMLITWKQELWQTNGIIAELFPALQNIFKRQNMLVNKQFTFLLISSPFLFTCERFIKIKRIHAFLSRVWKIWREGVPYRGRLLYFDQKRVHFIFYEKREFNFYAKILRWTSTWHKIILLTTRTSYFLHLPLYNELTSTGKEETKKQ